ncbi:VOC family protein [Aquincola sp. S2]|uniref:VOC family protein n=1 Tax=Pseudaquabacterium terrae TaxID=2732868 RepID=A0ABX2ENZ4_9BURK|nr:VOC family protein [Aquabacterium terrae]NRF70289.1 VOC family protein [Aquabacterium terrae]
MIDHLSIGTHRYAEAVAFYQRVLAPLGRELLRDTGAEAAFGTAAQWSFFLYPVPEGEPVTARGTHIAFAAPSRAAVRAVHAAALEAAGQDLFTPRERPDVSPTYYGAMFSDPDGHRIEVVTNAA